MGTQRLPEHSLRQALDKSMTLLDTLMHYGVLTFLVLLAVGAFSFVVTVGYQAFRDWS